MSEHQSNLYEIVEKHTNFFLDSTELRMHCDKKYSSDYLKIKDLIDIVEDLNHKAIKHVVYDDYIDIKIGELRNEQNL